MHDVLFLQPPYEISGDAGEEYCSDTKVSSTVFAVPALHTAVADRLTEHLASRVKAAKVSCGLVSWLTHSPTRPKILLLFLIAVLAFLSDDVKLDDDFSMNFTSDITK